jgi:hypothetical protein
MARGVLRCGWKPTEQNFPDRSFLTVLPCGIARRFP